MPIELLKSWLEYLVEYSHPDLYPATVASAPEEEEEAGGMEERDGNRCRESGFGEVVQEVVGFKRWAVDAQLKWERQSVIKLASQGPPPPTVGCTIAIL